MRVPSQCSSVDPARPAAVLRRALHSRRHARCAAVAVYSWGWGLVGKGYMERLLGSTQRRHGVRQKKRGGGSAVGGVLCTPRGRRRGRACAKQHRGERSGAVMVVGNNDGRRRSESRRAWGKGAGRRWGFCLSVHRVGGRTWARPPPRSESAYAVKGSWFQTCLRMGWMSERAEHALLAKRKRLRRRGRLTRQARAVPARTRRQRPRAGTVGSSPPRIPQAPQSRPAGVGGVGGGSGGCRLEDGV